MRTVVFRTNPPPTPGRPSHERTVDHHRVPRTERTKKNLKSKTRRRHTECQVLLCCVLCCFVLLRLRSQVAAQRFPSPSLSTVDVVFSSLHRTDAADLTHANKGCSFNPPKQQGMPTRTHLLAMRMGEALVGGARTTSSTKPTTTRNKFPQPKARRRVALLPAK